ncbi:hypothetical protein F3Y22_tig00111208pilonHSYRG00131 [Hibiscus syriacus]|uniref:Uncharacterized protein n=1 Tax=Hibiscus syriacus TaxID=106335 RepID=A0A6A2YVD4_HIBSY|nr:hypothetical protein F3Y22_tig00111208pilonHSYRG00131 [Hibiscus syriacus]
MLGLILALARAVECVKCHTVSRDSCDRGGSGNIECETNDLMDTEMYVRQLAGGGFIILPLLVVYGNGEGLLFPNLFHHFGNPMTGFEAPKFDESATLEADETGSSAAGDDVESAKHNGGSSQTLLVEGLERVVEAQTTFKGSWEFSIL